MQIPKQAYLCIILCLCCIYGCGSGGNGAITPYLSFGDRQGYPLGSEPSLSLAPYPNLIFNRQPVNPGTSPKIVMDEVIPFESTVSVKDSSLTTKTTLFVTGRVFNVDRNRAGVFVYALTNQYYLQPFTSAFAEICDGDFCDKGVWFCPAHEGKILVVLASSSYQMPETYPADSIPEADGVNILAVAQEP